MKIVLEEDSFDRDHIGPELIEQADQLALKLRQPASCVPRAIGGDNAKRFRSTPAPRGRSNDGKPAPSEPGIDTENEHVYDRSAAATATGGTTLRSRCRLPPTDRLVLADTSQVDSQNDRQLATELVVNVAGVSRWFDDVQALTNLTIEVPKGSITVLLGPNGAGKTTAIRMITGALTPDQGAVSVFGIDPGSDHGEEVRRRCGVVSAKPSLYDRLSGWDNLRYAAELYDLGRGSAADNRIAEAAAQFGIDQALDHQVGGYSTGMKTRLALARSVLHGPDLLLLDEPTSGLDPESAVAVLDLIKDMTGQGRTVLMCTHLLLEAEGLADEVVIMQHGTSLVWGPPAELSSAYWPSPIVRISSVLGSDLDHMAEEEGIVSYERSDLTATLEIDELASVPRLIKSLADAGVDVTAVQPFHPTLEDLYFAVRRQKGSAGDEVAPPPESTGRPTRATEMSR